MMYHFNITFKDHTTIYGFLNAKNYYDATKAVLDKYKKNDFYEEQQIADLHISIFELFNSKDSITEVSERVYNNVFQAIYGNE